MSLRMGVEEGEAGGEAVEACEGGAEEGLMDASGAGDGVDAVFLSFLTNAIRFGGVG